MSFSITEANVTRDLSSSASQYSIEVTYLVTADPGDVVNETDVRRYLLIDGGAAPILDGQPLNELVEVNRVNEWAYLCKLLYTSGEAPEDVEEEEEQEDETHTVRFDTTGGSEHISYGLSVKDRAGTFSTEIGAAINYDGEQINGVDIVRPAFNFSSTVQIPDSHMTLDYIGNLRS